MSVELKEKSKNITGPEGHEIISLDIITSFYTILRILSWYIPANLMRITNSKNCCNEIAGLLIN